MKRLIAELNNLMDDNISIYDEIDDNLYEIDNLTDAILATDNFVDEYDTVYDNLRYCEDYFSNIKNIVYDAKNNGIGNENELYRGKDVIKELENELEELSENLSEVENIESDLLNQIDEIEREIDELQSEVYASNSRLKKIEGKSFRFICHAHDEIYGLADYAESLCSDAQNRLEEKISSISEQTDEVYNELTSYFQSIIDDIVSNIYGIQDALSQARDMNDRMGNGIYDKISKIEELQDEIAQININIEEKNSSNEDLTYELDKLKDTLNELQSMLS